MNSIRRRMCLGCRLKCWEKNCYLFWPLDGLRLDRVWHCRNKPRPHTGPTWKSRCLNGHEKQFPQTRQSVEVVRRCCLPPHTRPLVFSLVFDIQFVCFFVRSSSSLIENTFHPIGWCGEVFYHWLTEKQAKFYHIHNGSPPLFTCRIKRIGIGRDVFVERQLADEHIQCGSQLALRLQPSPWRRRSLSITVGYFVLRQFS